MNSFRSSLVLIVLVSLALGLLFGPERAAAQRPMGIDVSSYQGSGDSPPTNIIWTNVQSAGIAFAWTKATEGTGYFDADFVYNMTQAKAAGVLIGAYHYCHPELHLGTNGADLEAAYFWSKVQPYITNGGFYLMPMLDFEQDVTNAIPPYTKTTLSQWVNEWCQDVVNYGLSNGVTVTPIVYTYTSYASGTSGMGPGVNNLVTNWPLWMAQYPKTPHPQTGAPSSTTPWPTWSLWQYSSTNTLSGIEGEVDVDVFNGTANAFGDFVIGGGLPTISTQPSNVTIIQGGAPNFTVGSLNSPITYQWQFDGTNIVGATNSQLTLTNVQPAASGNYDVVISNFTGSVTSTNALLTVVPMISNVVVMPRLSSAIISWNSATNASGQVFYGLDTNYSLSLPLVPALTTQHSAMLVGLQFDSTYYFEVVSTNGVYSGTNAGSFSTAVDLIVPSSQAYYSGIWTVDSAAPDKYGQYYEYAGTAGGADTAQAVFRPYIPSAGLYDVYFWYSEGTNRSLAAPVTVGYLGGSVENFVNEQTNGGSWQLLASAVPFAVGTNGYVRLGNGTGESKKVVIADATRFVYTAGQDLPVNNNPPAWWLNYFFGTNSVTGGQDSDGDGYSAFAEYVAGTVPTDPASYLHVRGQPAPGGGIQVIFSPYYFNAGRQYQLQTRSGLFGGAWTNLPLSPVTINTNGEGVMTVTNLVGPQNFLRVSVTMTQQ